MKYFKYLRYLIMHKYYVLLECWRVGLYWRGLKHDASKFLPSEFVPYANYFHGNKPFKRDSTGYYKPTDTGDDEFDFAWLLHQKRNDHHWQWWTLPMDSGDIKILPMSADARLEMLCDWRGAGKAQGTPDTVKWYAANKNKLLLHPDTRKWVEGKLNEF